MELLASDIRPNTVVARPYVMVTAHVSVSKDVVQTAPCSLARYMCACNQRQCQFFVLSVLIRYFMLRNQSAVQSLAYVRKLMVH